jgi:hypothetical protein
MQTKNKSAKARIVNVALVTDQDTIRRVVGRAGAESLRSSIPEHLFKPLVEELGLKLTPPPSTSYADYVDFYQVSSGKLGYPTLMTEDGSSGYLIEVGQAYNCIALTYYERISSS